MDWQLQKVDKEDYNFSTFSFYSCDQPLGKLLACSYALSKPEMPLSSLVVVVCLLLRIIYYYLFFGGGGGALSLGSGDIVL